MYDAQQQEETRAQLEHNQSSAGGLEEAGRPINSQFPHFLSLFSHQRSLMIMLMMIFQRGDVHRPKIGTCLSISGLICKHSANSAKVLHYA